MPGKFTYRKKKPSGYRKKSFGRRKMTMYKRPSYKSGVHHFKRVCTWGQLVPNNSFIWENSANYGGLQANASLVNFQIAAGSPLQTMSAISFASVFTLDALPNYTEFTSLFDAYQIRKIILKIQPYTTVATANPTQGGCFLHYAIDHDDNGVPLAGEAGIDQMKEYSSYKMVKILSSTRKPVTIVIRPRVNAVVEDVSVSQVVAATAPRNQWLDCNHADIPHFGLKGVFETINDSAIEQNFYMRCEVTYYLKFKGPR